MSQKVGRKTLKKQKARVKRHKRVRSAVYGSSDRPRLAVFKSHKHIYAQVIDDVQGRTLVQSASVNKGVKLKKGSNIDAATQVGTDVAKKAVAKKIKAVVFDVAGFRYHGRLKALAEAARKGGLKF